MSRSLAMLVATLLAGGCASSSPAGVVPDAGGGGSGGGTAGAGGSDGPGGDGGSGGSGGVGPVACVRDGDCDRDRAERCELPEGGAAGTCTPGAVGCATDVSCRSLDRDHCSGVEACVCVPSAAVPEGGICWRRTGFLEPCRIDAECGSGILYDRPARCAPIDCGDPAGTSLLCLPLDHPARTCPPGYVAGQDDDPRGDLSGLCVPPAGCEVEHCETDEDCRDPERPVCDPRRGLCVSGSCFVRTDRGETVGCPSAKPACHAQASTFDPGLLDDCVTAPTYGTGRCGRPCAGDDECAARGTDVSGAPWVCRERGGQLACAPRGCVDDGECPDAFGPHLGYCDARSESCVYDRCRLGLDPRVGCGLEEPYADCGTGFACLPDSSGGDSGTCQPIAF